MYNNNGMVGNMFQLNMYTTFNNDLFSSLSNRSFIKGKENLVFDYINKMRAVISQPNYSRCENPNGLYADHKSVKSDFVKYWKRALNIPQEKLQQLENIFDEAVITQEQSKMSNAVSVFFEDGYALTVNNCLYAVYDVLELE